MARKARSLITPSRAKNLVGVAKVVAPALIPVLAPVIAGHRSPTREVDDDVVRVMTEEPFHVALGQRLGRAPGDLLVGMGHVHSPLRRSALGTDRQAIAVCYLRANEEAQQLSSSSCSGCS